MSDIETTAEAPEETQAPAEAQPTADDDNQPVDVAKIQAILESNLGARMRTWLSICAHCKRIRNEQGQWEQMESYISHHSQTDFSHGLCPDCLKTHYAEPLPKPE